MPWRVLSRRIWLPSLYARLSFLLFSLSLLALYFYIVGNMQRFTDLTLMFLLRVESWFLGLSFLTSLFSFVSYILIIPLQGKLWPGRILFSALGVGLSLLLYLFVILLQAFMVSYG